MTWDEMAGAPEPGTVLCPAQDLPLGRVHALEIDEFGLLLVGTADGPRAYVNACPHQFLPLTWRSEDVLTEDSARISCSNHDAVFDAATGVGQTGFGAGCALIPVPIRRVADRLVIG